MKKFITFCLSATMLLSGASAEARVTLREAQQMMKEGKSIKLPANAYKQAQNSRLRTASSGMGKIQQRPASKLLKKSPARITAGGSSIFGYSNYAENEGFVPGMFELMEEDLQLMWEDPVYADSYATLSGAYVQDGILKGYSTESSWGGIYALYYTEIDFETGELVSSEPLDLSVAPVYNRLAYVPDEDMIYGFGYLMDYENGVFMKTDPSDPSGFEVIKEFADFNEVPVALCSNQADNAFYGINGYREFVRIDFDGEISKLFTIEGIEYGAGYYAGLVYSPVENIYYWNVNQDVNAFMAKIDASTGSVDVYEQLANSNQLTFLLSTDEVVMNEFAPNRPEVAEIGFPAGDLTGYVSYQLPTNYAGGDPIMADLDVYTSLDGVVTSQGRAKPGSIYTVTYDNLSEGKHKFGCYVSDDGVNSAEVSKSVYIGNDTPQAPTNVILTDNLVSWDAIPSAGVNKGYIAIDDIVYIVYLNGEEYGRTKECKLPIVLPSDNPLDLYRVTVVAECNGKTSKAAESNGVVAGQPLSLPVNIVPTADQASVCSTYDGNGNGASWGYSEEGYFKISYTDAGTGNQDDWLFLPPVKFDSADKYYSLSYEAVAGSASYPDEYMEVFIGTAPDPEAMTTEVVEEYMLDATGYQTTEVNFQVSAAGVYYVGFHCTSKEDQLGINLRNINIFDDNVTDNSPAAVINLDAVGADQGVLKATVSFTMPTKTVGGAELAADAALKATVTAAGTTPVEGKPGERITIEVETVQSMNHIAVRASLGDLNGPKEFIDVYTGVEIPASVSNLQGTASPDMMSMTLTWEGPTEGYNGGYINPETVTYAIIQLVPTIFGYMPVQIGETSETSYTYQCEEGQIQDLQEIGVASVNEAGVNSDFPYLSEILGTPWALPMDENFDDPQNTMMYSPWMIYQFDLDNPVSWAIDYLSNIDDTFDPDHIGLVGTPAAAGTKGRLGVPRFTTAGIDEAAVTVNLYVGSESAGYQISGFCYGMEEPVVLGTVNGDNADKQFEDYTFSLPAELLGKDWVQIYIDCDFSSDEDVAVIDSFLATGNGIGTGVKSAVNSTAIFGGKNTITVRGFEGQNVTVSALNGAVVANGIAASNEQVFTLDKGVYVVKAADRKVKVLVK